jgi:ABC-type Fe3+-hydroxamate transport system substrate-binding protein
MAIDAFGQDHPVTDGDARIVSLVPSITELLFELGLDAQIVGRTGFCVHPKTKVRGVTKVGGTKDVDLEAVRKLRPSHVIVNIDENTREIFDALKPFVPHVVVTHPNDPRDNTGLYDLLGTIFECRAEARRLASAFERAMKQVADTSSRLPQRHVLYLIWRDPWMTVSPDTYISRTLALVKWQTMPLSGEARYPTLSTSELNHLTVDLCLLASEPYPFRDKHLDEVAGLLAKHSPVKLIDGEMVSWYGSRAIAGLGYLADFALTAVERAA